MSNNKTFNIYTKSVAWCVIISFCLLTVVPPRPARAQTFLNLPVPGTMVAQSTAFVPAMLKGIKIHPENPFLFDFYLDTGDQTIDAEAIRQESIRLVNYFLASLTVPQEDLWVNLSPYEENRIIPNAFGVTEMGRDMLAQDYLLKQLTSSLMYPEDEVGKTFWDKVHAQALAKYGTTDVNVDTFNKVWIVPDRVVVYEHGDSAFVVKSNLKVMLEEDYYAQQNQTQKQQTEIIKEESNELSSQIIREIIIPILEKEVNEAENFANLRQIFNSLILATWFKRNLWESVLGQVYMDQNKVAGIDLDDKETKQKIYNQYLEAYKKGVYDFIKEDYDPVTQQIIPRKYFSGGLVAAITDDKYEVTDNAQLAQASVVGDMAMLQVKIERATENTSDQAMAAGEEDFNRAKQLFRDRDFEQARVWFDFVSADSNVDDPIRQRAQYMRGNLEKAVELDGNGRLTEAGFSFLSAESNVEDIIRLIQNYENRTAFFKVLEIEDDQKRLDTLREVVDDRIIPLILSNDLSDIDKGDLSEHLMYFLNNLQSPSLYEQSSDEDYSSVFDDRTENLIQKAAILQDYLAYAFPIVESEFVDVYPTRMGQLMARYNKLTQYEMEDKLAVLFEEITLYPNKRRRALMQLSIFLRRDRNDPNMWAALNKFIVTMFDPIIKDLVEPLAEMVKDADLFPGEDIDVDPKSEASEKSITATLLLVINPEIDIQADNRELLDNLVRNISLIAQANGKDISELIRSSVEYDYFEDYKEQLQSAADFVLQYLDEAADQAMMGMSREETEAFAQKIFEILSKTQEGLELTTQSGNLVWRINPKDVQAADGLDLVRISWSSVGSGNSLVRIRVFNNKDIARLVFEQIPSDVHYTFEVREQPPSGFGVFISFGAMPGWMSKRVPAGKDLDEYIDELLMGVQASKHLDEHLEKNAEFTEDEKRFWKAMTLVDRGKLYEAVAVLRDISAVPEMTSEVLAAANSIMASFKEEELVSRLKGGLTVEDDLEERYFTRRGAPARTMTDARVEAVLARGPGFLEQMDATANLLRRIFGRDNPDETSEDQAMVSQADYLRYLSNLEEVLRDYGFDFELVRAPSRTRVFVNGEEVLLVTLASDLGNLLSVDVKDREYTLYARIATPDYMYDTVLNEMSDNPVVIIELGSDPIDEPSEEEIRQTEFLERQARKISDALKDKYPQLMYRKGVFASFAFYIQPFIDEEQTPNIATVGMSPFYQDNPEAFQIRVKDSRFISDIFSAIITDQYFFIEVYENGIVLTVNVPEEHRTVIPSGQSISEYIANLDIQNQTDDALARLTREETVLISAMAEAFAGDLDQALVLLTEEQPATELSVLNAQRFIDMRSEDQVYMSQGGEVENLTFLQTIDQLKEALTIRGFLNVRERYFDGESPIVFTLTQEFNRIERVLNRIIDEAASDAAMAANPQDMFASEFESQLLEQEVVRNIKVIQRDSVRFKYTKPFQISPVGTIAFDVGTAKDLIAAGAMNVDDSLVLDAYYLVDSVTKKYIKLGREGDIDLGRSDFTEELGVFPGHQHISRNKEKGGTGHVRLNFENGIVNLVTVDGLSATGVTQLTYSERIVGVPQRAVALPQVDYSLVYAKPISITLAPKAQEKITLQIVSNTDVPDSHPNAENIRNNFGSYYVISDAGDYIEITEEGVSLGREGDVRFKALSGNMRISAKHILVKRKGHQIILRDLNSTNQTYVSGFKTFVRERFDVDLQVIRRAVETKNYKVRNKLFPGKYLGDLTIAFNKVTYHIDELGVSVAKFPWYNIVKFRVEEDQTLSTNLWEGLPLEFQILIALYNKSVKESSDPGVKSIIEPIVVEEDVESLDTARRELLNKTSLSLSKSQPVLLNLANVGYFYFGTVQDLIRLNVIAVESAAAVPADSFVFADQKGKFVQVSPTGAVIGRKFIQDTFWVAGDSRQISGNHLTITFDGDNYIVTDTSTNGTEVVYQENIREEDSAMSAEGLPNFDLDERIDFSGMVDQMRAWDAVLKSFIMGLASELIAGIPLHQAFFRIQIQITRSMSAFGDLNGFEALSAMLGFYLTGQPLSYDELEDRMDQSLSEDVEALKVMPYIFSAILVDINDIREQVTSVGDVLRNYRRSAKIAGVDIQALDNFWPEGVGPTPQKSTARDIELVNRAIHLVLGNVDFPADEERFDLSGDAAMTVEDQEQLLKEVFEQEGFRLQERLGKGHVGIVYRATRLADQKEFALKVSVPRLEQWRKNFQYRRVQAQEVKKIIDKQGEGHPNVIRYEQAGAVDIDGEKRDYAVMEFFEGQTLKEALAEGGLADGMALRDFVSVMIQILEALDYLESQQLLRYVDIESNDIMINEDWQVKLIDMDENRLRRNLKYPVLDVVRQMFWQILSSRRFDRRDPLRLKISPVVSDMQNRRIIKGDFKRHADALKGILTVDQAMTAQDDDDALGEVIAELEASVADTGYDAVYRYLYDLGVRNFTKINKPGRFTGRGRVYDESIENKIRPIVEYLQSLGVVNIARIIEKEPMILVHSLENKIKPVAQVLLEAGIDNVGEFVEKYPTVFALDLEGNLKPKLELIRSITGPDQDILGTELTRVLIKNLNLLRLIKKVSDDNALENGMTVSGLLRAYTTLEYRIRTKEGSAVVTWMNSADAETEKTRRLNVILKEVQDILGVKPADSAQLTDSDTVGGIDFNPQNINIERQGSGIDIAPQMDPAMLDPANVDGFYPVILNVIPVTNIPLILGVADQQQNSDQARFTNYQSDAFLAFAR